MRLMERWRQLGGFGGWGMGGAVTLEGFWIWLSVYPCLRTSWRHKCQLWAVCGLPTKLLARSNPDWFYLLDSWHATCEPWPSMCHSNAMASQPPLTSALMDIRVSIFFFCTFRLSAPAAAFPIVPVFRWIQSCCFFFPLVFFLRLSLFWPHLRLSDFLISNRATELQTLITGKMQRSRKCCDHNMELV